jgi:hypothetical protein
VMAVETGRFTGDGLVWALAQPLPILAHWHDVMLFVRGNHVG